MLSFCLPSPTPRRANDWAVPEPISQLTTGLERLLPRCDLRTEGRIRRDIARLERSRRLDPRVELRRLTTIAEKAAAALERRNRRRPVPRFDASLPIAAHREELAGLIARHPVVVVCGETGSGKSTQLPLICLEAGRGTRGMIAHTQPRRIAARTIAQRLSDELGVGLGREVGYKVRFTDQTDPGTFIKVVTDGMLLAELQGDRRLLRYDTIIIDEAHERSLNIDFLLGCLRRLTERRPEMRVIVTSATIDPDRFSRHFGRAPIVEVSGRTFPVDIRYRPPAGDGGGEEESAPDQPLLDAASELAREGPGDILVFLPGEREIREAAEVFGSFAEVRSGRAEVLPLYARQSSADQMKAFQQHDRRRIILATNIAETSVTVPGVHYVIDTGVARISRYSSRSKVQGLPVEPISQASANQRAGRCGRVADGVCIRLYSEQDFDERPAYTDPEILRSNLAGVVLQMKALRLGDPARFPFIDRPPPRRWRDGIETLEELHALDESGGLTEIGQRLAKLPVDPRLGRMLIAAGEEHALREVTVIAAALATRDPRERPMEKRDAADAAHAEFVDESSDFVTLLNLWTAAREAERELSGRAFRRWCRDRFISWRGMREWQDLHRQLGRISRTVGLRRETRPATPDSVHRSVLAGLLCNIGVRGERHEYQGTHGSEFYIHPGSVLFSRKPRWIVAAEMTRTTQLYARMVAPIRPEWIETLGSHLLTPTHSNPTWDDRAATPTVIERVSLFGVQLPAKRRVPYGSLNPVLAREMFIRHGLVEGRFRPHADFVDHNDRMIQEVRRLEAKARRRDLQAEAGARFDFFDQRLPPQVWSGKRFDRWRHKAEHRDRRVLWMSPQDLMIGSPEPLTEEEFPDAVPIAGVERDLEYHHDPGEADDGVVLRLPAAALAALTEREYDHLIPGLLRERLIEMIRGLPKPLRRGIGPAPQLVDELLGHAEIERAPLAEVLAEYLRRTRGLHIDAADLRTAPVPDHLLPKLIVVDDRGASLAEGRDLMELKRSVRGDVEATLAEAGSDIRPRRGVREWDFGDLPELTEARSDSSVLTAHVGLADEFDAAAIRLFADAESAQASHACGVRRLLAINSRREFNRLMKGRPGESAMRLAYASLRRQTSLDDELLLVAIEQVIDRERLSMIRESSAFDAAQVEIDAGLTESVASAFDLVERVLEAAHSVLRAVDRDHPPTWRESVADITDQVERLLPEPPLSVHQPDRIRHFARYLRGASRRLDKLAGGGLERDVRLLRELRPRWERWVALEPELQDIPRSAPVWQVALDYRWMLEELRISLFAQELGTAGRISTVRLDERWKRVRDAVREDPRLAHLFAPSSRPA